MQVFWAFAMRALGLLVVALAPALAQAACPAGAVTNAVHARLSDEALKMLTGPLIASIPGSVEVPEETVVLFECPEYFDDTTLTPLNGEIQITLKSANVWFEPGGVVFTATADISAAADLDVIVCALPDALCPATLLAEDVVLTARVDPEVNACSATFPVALMEVELDPADVTIDLGDCGLYDEAFDFTYDVFGELMVGLAIDEMEDMVTEALPGWLEGITAGLLADGFEVAGMKLTVAPETIDVQPSGIKMSFTADARPLEVADCLPSGVSLPSEPSGGPAPILTGAPLSVAAAQPFVQRVLRAAWLAGWLCFDSRAFGLDLGESLADLFGEATLDFVVAAETPPKLTLLASSADSPEATARLDVETIAAEVELVLGEAEPNVATAELEASLWGEFDVDLALRALTFAPTSVETTGTVVNVEDASLGFSEESLQGFIENMAMPLFAQEVGRVPLTSSLMVTAPVALSLQAVSTTTSHVRADFFLVPIDGSDEEAPVTRITTLPPMPSPSDVVLEMSSIDDRTPAPLLRHWVRVDGVVEEAPRSGERLVLTGLSQGIHEVELAAVDLSDNTDATPLTLAVVVDGEAPLVVIDSAPLGVFEDEVAEVHFSAKDDTTPARDLAYRYTVGLVSRQNEPDELLFSGELEKPALTLGSLPDDALVRVTVYATDAAGNEGWAVSAFYVDRTPSLGCRAVGGGHGAGTSGVWLALALLALRRRR